MTSRLSPEAILAVARRAGFDPKKVAQNEYVVRCPLRHLHRNGDQHPSCRLNDVKGTFHCPVCGCGGGIKDFAELVGVPLSDVLGSTSTVPPGGRTEGNDCKRLHFDSNGPITLATQAKIKELLNKAYAPDAWTKAAVHEGAAGDWPAIAFSLPKGGWKACLYTRPDPKRGKRYTFWFTDGGKADLLIVGSSDQVLLVAGEWDLLAALSVGFPCVATSTGGESCFKPDWSRCLPEVPVFILYDVDEAGRNGAGKAARLLAEAGREVYVVRLPLSGDEEGDGKDLSDFFALHDASALRELLDETRQKGRFVAHETDGALKTDGARSTEGISREIDEILTFVPPDAEAVFKDGVFKRLLPLLVRLDPVAQDLIVHKVKEKLDVGLGAIREEIKRFRPSGDSPPDHDPALPEVRPESRVLLQDPNLIWRFLEDTTALGLIGEDHNKITLLFVMTSRLCSHPMNAVVKGESAVGKNYLVATIARCFPPGQVINITTLSPQSLSYWDGDLVHKILIVAEAEGADRAEYTFRVLQSEGHLTVYYVAKVGGELKTIEKTVEGPAATITTTTRESLHPENETRLIEIVLDESAEQTARITTFQAKQRAEGTDPQLAEAIIERWRGAQALLEPLPVIIPFAELIRFPSKQVRARRDFPKLLTLIEVSAFLHQFQREQKEVRGQAHIVADLRDYAIAYDLLHGFIERVQSGLNDRQARVRDELERRSPERLTARQVADVLGWYQESGRKRAKRCLESLHEKGWAEATGHQAGVATAYWFATARPQTDPGISTPEEMAAAVAAQGGHLPTTWTSPLSRSKTKS